MTSYDNVVTRFGRKPEVQVFSPTEYRVTISGWHVHNGASSGRPIGDGRSLDGACRALLAYVDRPASMVFEGEYCDRVCHVKYAKSEPHQEAARASLRSVVEDAARTVDSWPAWKRGLPPCEDERCERELHHKGKHRAARPVEFDEW